VQKKRRSEEIKDDRIKIGVLDSEELREQLKQVGITESRSEFVVKEYVLFVNYLNSTQSTDGLEGKLAQLKNTLSDEELVVVLQQVEKKLRGV
jgi:hypothetical protein